MLYPPGFNSEVMVLVLKKMNAYPVGMFECAVTRMQGTASEG